MVSKLNPHSQYSEVMFEKGPKYRMRLQLSMKGGAEDIKADLEVRSIARWFKFVSVCIVLFQLRAKQIQVLEKDKTWESLKFLTC